MGYIEELRKRVGDMPLILSSSGAIIKNDSGQILLEYRMDTDDWGIPGGYMEPGETFEDTIKRELWEELSTKVENLSLFGVFSGPEYYHEYPNGDQVYSVIALFEAIVMGTIKVDNQEIANAEFFNAAEIPTKLTNVSRKLLEQYLKT